MSWLFSQALVEAYSEANFLTEESSAQLNVMPTPQLFWRNDKTMAFSKFSQFGPTSRLLTADHGEELLTWFREVSLARISVQPGGGAGIDGEKSGLWREMARIIGEVRPAHVFVENSPILTSRGLGRVLGDLAEMGYDAEWGVLGAYHSGAPHKRERIWICAHAKSGGFSELRGASRESGHVDELDETMGDACRIGRGQGRDNNGEHDGAITQPDGEDSAPLAYTQGFRSWTGLCQDGQERNRVESGDGNSHVAFTQGIGPQGGRPRQDGEPQRQAAQWERACNGSSALADAESQHAGYGHDGNAQALRAIKTGRKKRSSVRSGQWWAVEPDVGRVANGVAFRVDRLKAIGNGQVPAVVELAHGILAEI